MKNNSIKSILACLFFILLTSCDSSKALPDNITEIRFLYSTYSLFDPTGEDASFTVNIADKSANLVITQEDVTSCTLIYTLTASQIDSINELISKTKYKTADYTDEELSSFANDSADPNRVNFVADGSDLSIYKENPNIPLSSSYKYFSEGATELYSYIIQLISEHSDISTCPDTWGSL